MTNWAKFTPTGARLQRVPILIYSIIVAFTTRFSQPIFSY
jgi:hypothetical protein